MKTIGIFYGSSNGTTESVAKQIAEKLGVKSADIHNVGQASPADFASYEVLLLGSSTWGAGDLQDDWYDFLPKIKKLDLSGKLVGLFGCGDSSSFSDTFCDAIGTIYNDLKATGCKFVGSMDTSSYTYDDSTAVVDGKFVGLALDEMNEDDQTPVRIDAWIESLKKDGVE
ncbi:flavodoxin [Parabacteroides johnsonii DSM 18315]|mgnify:FL=1|jgi:flavodoxin|uniref:Flavodoxin n=3 Tax=Parabacteroides johnsonii TaxID=387661 RepID=K6AKT3_9BACT|nr:flavodoxin [Parabacteroides johnsonii]CCX76522.1 putative uncharacterized protein [Parabacteroides johnsonii CAG:246]EEC94317.1 flavodoxin [Parabacteroides johnsonii DSM 18315]EKN16328.1 flavodoxin [Parabacteroides johnsonii CL02T12C29]OUO04303.1 flavodoxin [Parabacteroides johnsonii]UEA90464.1 flavodoxin [Parabacteroides johnsonii]